MCLFRTSKVLLRAEDDSQGSGSVNFDEESEDEQEVPEYQDLGKQNKRKMYLRGLRYLVP